MRVGVCKRVRLPRIELGIPQPQCNVLTTIPQAPGEAGYRSQYLAHAKRALYHLSYIPATGHSDPAEQRTLEHFYPSLCALCQHYTLRMCTKSRTLSTSTLSCTSYRAQTSQWLETHTNAHRHSRWFTYDNTLANASQHCHFVHHLL